MKFSLFGLDRLWSSTPRSRISRRSMAVRESNIGKAAQLVEHLMQTQVAGDPNTRVLNLGQGVSEYSTPDVLKQALKDATDADQNQYCNTWGYTPLRQRIARLAGSFNGIQVDPEKHVTVMCGCSEVLVASIQAICDPGDEVIIVEPFYENHLADVVMAGATPRFVRLRGPDFTFSTKELVNAFNKRTKAIVFSNPHNPTGRVFTRDELELIAKLCQYWGAFAISDEIYERLTYDGVRHISMATIPGMEDLTITVSGVSKTYNVTGWRIGWMIGPEDVSREVRKLHRYITLCAPTPEQVASCVALDFPDSFYTDTVAKYAAGRDTLAAAAREAGFAFRMPQGAYYLMVDASPLRCANDYHAWEWMLRNHRLTTVAGYCFHDDPNTNLLRFCFAKKPDTIALAGERLKRAAAQRRG